MDQNLPEIPGWNEFIERLRENKKLDELKHFTTRIIDSEFRDGNPLPRTQESINVRKEILEFIKQEGKGIDELLPYIERVQKTINKMEAELNARKICE